MCAEDARVVRAALCAGAGEGLQPRAGAVWLLPATLPPAWLHRDAADAHNCSQQQLDDTAAGHLSVAPAWLVDWEERDAGAPEHAAWTARWRRQCCLQRGACAPGDCVRAPAYSALLYDALRMWDAALRRQLHAHPAALDNLHHRGIAR